MKAFFLILASAALVAPAGAAEIGARTSWGHTTSHVRDGRSVTRSHSVGAYAENSSSHSHGADFSRREVGAFSSSTRESYNFSSNSTGGFSEHSTFTR